MDFIGVNKDSIFEPHVVASAAVMALSLAAYQYYSGTYLYWEKRGVRGPKPWPLFHFIRDNLLRTRNEVALECREKYGRVHGFNGVGTPALMVADAEVVRQITIKDFDAFVNHRPNEWQNRYQRKFLVFMQDDDWRRMRVHMTPSFTSGKMKRMYKLMDGCADDLVLCIREKMAGERERELRLVQTYSLYTMDGITTCCYGLRLTRERKEAAANKFSPREDLIRDCTNIASFTPARLVALGLVPKPLLRLIGFKMAAEESMRPLLRRVELLVQKRRETPNKYDDLLQMLVDARLDDKLELSELDGEENHHAGLTKESILNDQKALLSGTKQSQRIEPSSGLEDEEILSTAAFMLAAGLDTTKVSLSSTSYMLAFHPEVQERLYGELKQIAAYDEHKQSYSFEYEALTSCKYLDAVISETMRLFGPVTYTDRVATRDYYIEKYDVHVPKGSSVLIGIHAIHKDADYWPQPDKYDPDRFMPENRDKIVPGSYLPFGQGPRHCIGMRFSLTEAKLGLAKLLMQFKFKPAPDTSFPPTPRRLSTLTMVSDDRVIFERRY